MKYGYEIKFYGEVNSIDDPENTQTENIEDIRVLVIESFHPDLQAGVRVKGTQISIDEIGK